MKTVITGLALLALAPTASADTFNVYGLWLTEAKTAHIEVTDCGDGTPCGSLAWVDPLTADTDSDIRNANTDLRERPLIGVPIVWGYERGKKNWSSGHIYNPEDGKTFKSVMRLQKDGTLEVKGCLGFLCITNIWTRVTQPSIAPKSSQEN